MKSACDHIVCMPMFNSYGVLDRVLTGNATVSRSFVSVHDLMLALSACGVKPDSIRAQLSQLEMGFSVDVPASQEQMASFYECRAAAFARKRLTTTNASRPRIEFQRRQIPRTSAS